MGDSPPPKLGVRRQGLRLIFSPPRAPRSSNGGAALATPPCADHAEGNGSLERIVAGPPLLGGIARYCGHNFYVASCHRRTRHWRASSPNLAPAVRAAACGGQSRRGRLTSSLSRLRPLATITRRRSALSARALGLSVPRSLRKRRQTRALLGPTGQFECAPGNGRCGGQWDGHG